MGKSMYYFLAKRHLGFDVDEALPPDIEIENDPELVRQGKDPQLEKAVELILAELGKNPVAKPKRPVYPDYHKK